MASDIGDEESLSGNKIQPLNSTPKSNKWKHEDEGAPVTLSDRLALGDFFSINVWRAAVAELLGTAILVFMIDTIVISTIETHIKAPNLTISVLIGLTITVLLLAVFPISGGHINPVVSFSAALVGLISIPRAFIYILAQCGGALLGAMAVKAVVSSAIQQTFSLGGCTLTIIVLGPQGPITMGLETAQALSLEVICTFIFLFGSIWIVFDERQSRRFGPVVVCSIVGTVLGLLVFVSTTVTGAKGYAGAGINPARCLGPAVIRGGHLWNRHWVFWAGPGIGSLVFYIYTKIIPRQHYHAKGYKHDVVEIVKASIM
ncbi:aquaporin-5-like [Impatiens glandulifera]|uniref:aquaporin-5-like n=1 Tax=Impatiens glandulifera TaxID=253017 RepID=UPI001FB0FA83|nr:aquaporin-5-like [Impatiens glandulifera]